MKRGYTFEDQGEVKLGLYTFTVKSLIRETKNELAAILIITKSDASGKTYYVCLPINNKDLFVRYSNDINAWDEALTTTYCFVVSGYLSSMASATYEIAEIQQIKALPLPPAILWASSKPPGIDERL
ncbi:MAG TPA: hypothetical protein VK658_09685 [Chryseolinea sp.]|nr:hypothetical protein [Chryseolinea sp.]